tara:strand:- start:800 stop:1141 length:342 start_codon:yes stop_codon:yes gene_type:complete
MQKFRPKCMTSTTQIAVDNRGRLLPCCYIDTPKWIQYPEIKKLLNVSVISENESLRDIITTNEWTKFYETLSTGDLDKIPDVCKHHCLDDGEDRLKVEEWFDDSGNMIKRKGK